MEKESRLPYGCVSLFLLPVALFGAGLVSSAGGSLSLYRDSADWVPVQARIEAADLERDAGSEATALKATYAYDFEGRTYRSSRPVIETGMSSDAVHARRASILQTAMAAGTTLPALVDPENPSQALLFRELRPSTVVVFVVGLAFLLVGLAWVVLFLRLRKNAAWRDRRREQFPDMPWRHQRFWVDFQVRSNAGRVLIGGWAFTVFMGLLGAPFVIFFGDGSSGSAGQIAIWALAGLWGLGLLIVLRTTVRYLRHGVSTLVLSEVPLRPGRRVSGGVQLADTTQPQPLECKLRCVLTKTREEHRVEDGEVRREMYSYDLHESSFAIDPSVWRRQDGGWFVPLSLDVPADALSRTESLRWFLHVRFAGTGIRAEHTFDLPVFQGETIEQQALLA